MMPAHDDDYLSFLDEHVAGDDADTALANAKWCILIVDDEQDVHSVTTFALQDYIYLNKRLHFVSAYNDVEAREALTRSPDIALILLDVVMTTADSGLRLVKFIREELDNQRVQIILRTGQPGDVPEEQMVKRYRVNDYKLKTELTREKLFSAVTLALRSYEQLGELAAVNDKLNAANVELAAFNHKLQSLVDERTAALRQQSEHLELALLDKTNLLRIMAHDLRNYMAIAKWSSELALAADDLQKTSAFLTKVLWAIDRQSLLINKVASVEALRSGKQELACESRLLAELLQSIHLTFEQRLNDKAVQLNLVWRCSQQVRVWVDPVVFLDSVINNIVSNAVKFSSPGDCIWCEVADTDGREVVISIRDSGVGMPESLLKSLFGYNDQTSRIGTRGERGIGFGMPIVKMSLERMHGWIKVESKVKEPGSIDHGTIVTIGVPCQRR